MADSTELQMEFQRQYCLYNASVLIDDAGGAQDKDTAYAAAKTSVDNIVGVVIDSYGSLGMFNFINDANTQTLSLEVGEIVMYPGLETSLSNADSSDLASAATSFSDELSIQLWGEEAVILGKSVYRYNSGSGSSTGMDFYAELEYDATGLGGSWASVVANEAAANAIQTFIDTALDNLTESTIASYNSIEIYAEIDKDNGQQAIRLVVKGLVEDTTSANWLSNNYSGGLGDGYIFLGAIKDQINFDGANNVRCVSGTCRLESRVVSGVVSGNERMGVGPHVSRFTWDTETYISTKASANAINTAWATAIVTQLGVGSSVGRTIITATITEGGTSYNQACAEDIIDASANDWLANTVLAGGAMAASACTDFKATAETYAFTEYVYKGEKWAV